MQKGYDLLGLAQRAGQAKSGEAASEALIKKKKVKLVLLAVDASDRTKQYFINLARSQKTPWLAAGEKIRFGAALGKTPRSVVVVTDINFARKLKELFEGEKEDF